tara:strand:+ start:3845 stop:4822 length:978 start_codon:yes stop_codon:yes gene_type:complete
MSGINIPTDSAHLSDLSVAEMIEEFGGTVDGQFAKKSMMRKFAGVKPVRGTDTLINRRVGRTELAALTAGVRPPATKTEFGRTSVVVDTVLLARDNRSMLNEFQTDFNARKELAVDHGKELGKKFDQSMLIAGMKGAYATDAGTPDYNGAFGDGKNTVLTGAGDELDPDLFYTGIESVIVAMQEEDIDTDECAIFVRPTQHAVLLNNDKLVDRDFTGNGSDFAAGVIKTVMGCPIMPTNRLVNAALVGHELSNTRNSDFYDVSATEALTRALILHPDALLAGETIPLASDIYFDKIERQWFIDSYMSYGANFRRQDACGAVRAFS